MYGNPLRYGHGVALNYQSARGIWGHRQDRYVVCILLQNIMSLFTERCTSGPNEISIRDPSLIDTLMGATGAPKGPSTCSRLW